MKNKYETPLMDIKEIVNDSVIACSGGDDEGGWKDDWNLNQ